MKLIRLIVILLIGLFVLPSLDVEAARPKRKKAKVTAVSKSRSKTSRSKSSKSRKKQSAKKRSSRQRVSRKTSARRSAALAAEYAARREELRREDSIRLRIGGTEPLAMGQEVTMIANYEPMLSRFRKADSTLTMKNIESLYFTRQAAEGDSVFFGQIIPKVDNAIEREQYREALVVAQKGLYRNPMHIGLLKRACDLAEHENSKELDNYIWQITELFNLIQHTGDGKSIETALRVKEMDDAILYEMLWLDTIKERIVERKLVPYKDKQALTLGVRDPKGKIVKKYYIVG